MDCHLEHTASIVNALVDTLDEEDKKQDVLSSWKGFVVEVISHSISCLPMFSRFLKQKKQFPELTPMSVGSDYAGIASGRVLNAKHATFARSSQSVWNRVAMAANSSAPSKPKSQERFPALGGSSLSTHSVGKRRTPWSNSSPPLPPTYRPPQSFSVPQSGPAQSKTPPGLSRAQFPDLPPSSTARTKVPVSGNVSLMNILGNSGPPSTNVWGSSPPASTPPFEPALRTQPADESKNKRKGKQKQTLFTLGSIPT